MSFLRALFSMLLGVFMTHTPSAAALDKRAYDFSFTGIDGKPLPLSAYKGKVLLIVNTASKCGFTPQYKQLEDLWQRYKGKGLVVIGVPSNDFGQQEPGDEAEIQRFCEINYGVTFPLTSKQSVTGENAHPFYQWAQSALGKGSAPKWNFHKYLVGPDGTLADYFNSTTSPVSDKVTETIEVLLAKR